ncbi:hypothetical protein JCM9279_002989 [Rhodotorula babjevae]
MAGGAGLTVRPAYHTGSRWVGRSAVLPSNPSAPQWLRWLVLTAPLFGLQLVWSCEMAQASPFLLSLGVSKSMMSIVFLAGPLSGLIVQPLVGVLSDRCKSTLGRRRPFIVGGCACSSVSVLMLGWSKEIAAVFADDGTTLHNHLAIACAVVSVYFIDFSVNVIQAMDRSLLVDVVPPAQQPAVNAWAGRMFGFGAVFGYWIGGIDLVWWTRGWLGGEQLKVLTIFTSVLLIGTHAVTVTCVRERILISRAGDDDAAHAPGTASSSSSSGALRALADVWHTIRHLPRPIQQVFNVQFTGWIGWFPVLFFSTTWVAEMYVKTQWAEGGPGSELADAPDDVRARATRAGTHAMLWHSVVSLATSIVLPPLVAAGSTGASSSPHDHSSFTSSRRTGPSSSSSRLLARAKALLPRIPFDWLSLPLLWAMSNTLFSALLFATLFAKSVAGASFIVAAAGFAWAVTNWAPFALLGDLILRMGTSSNCSLSLASPNPSSVMLHHLDHRSSSASDRAPPRSSADSWGSGSEDGGAGQRERMLDPSAPHELERKYGGAGSSARSPAASHFDDPHRTPTTTLDHHHHDGAFSLGDDLDLDSDGSPTFSGVADPDPDPASTSSSAPRTPTTARSLYFDAASAAGSSAGDHQSGIMSRSTSAHSFASASSGAGSATPTLTASPGGGGGASGSGNEWGARVRGDSDASEGPMRFPPNHGSVGVDLFSSDPNPYPPPPSSAIGPAATHEHAYGADPYAYPAAVRQFDFGAPLDGGAAGASSSTIHLPPPRGGVAAFGRIGAGVGAGSPAPSAGGLYALDGGASDEGRDGGDAHVLQIRHSDSFELDERERLHLGGGSGGGGGTGDERRRGGAASAQGTPRIFVGGGEGEEESPEEWGTQDDEEGGGHGGAGQQQVGGGDQTGVILGCHNIYLVLPQFLVTALSSIIFALLAPHHSVLGHHTPAHHSASSDTGLVGGVGDEQDGFVDLGEGEFGDDGRRRNLVVRAVRVVGGAIGEAFAAKVRRQEVGDGEVELPPGGEAGWDALGLIFRVGGVAAACSAYICFRMWRESLTAERRARSAQRGYRLTG